MRKIVLLVFAVLSMCCQVAAQDRQVTGTVTDGEGQPLVGVTVLVKGSTRGVSTDAFGKYAVSVPSGATLQFSHLGYDPLEVGVGNKSVLNVAMTENTTALDDVIVVAFDMKRGVHERVRQTLRTLENPGRHYARLFADLRLRFLAAGK